MILFANTIVFIQLPATCPEVAHTRSDSNSLLMDDSEFDEEILHLMSNDDDAFQIFQSLYSDLKFGTQGNNQQVRKD